MAGYVVDASVAVEYLLKTPLGLTLADTLENASLVAPELIDAEVLSALRRSVLRGALQETRAKIVVDSLAHWPVHRVSHRDLVPVAWQYYHNVSAYDAFYVATARAYGLPLLTADGRLARAPDLSIVVQSVRIS